jgi:acetyl-CoA C-acetyltransferase
MQSTVILATARTPFGKLGGALVGVDAAELGGRAMSAALERAGVAPEQVDHVAFGQVLQAGQGQIPSRQAQIDAGIPRQVHSETINKVCASGMRAVGIADLAIRAGETHVAVAGGMESMSRAPYLLPAARFGGHLGDIPVVDALVHDGLTSPFSGKRMIDEADDVASKLKISRTEMDRYAERSHRGAASATDAGLLASEITPVTGGIQGRDLVVTLDEAIRPETTFRRLARLPAVGGSHASHTAGNTPGVSDGACALVLASASWAEQHAHTPLARVLSYGTYADDFAALAKTPANAALGALAKAGRAADEVALWEINEAFASVVLNSIRILNIDPKLVNVNGGAIALGHPIGASGARIIGALVHELRRRGGGLGCAAICSGGGQGDAIVLECYGR